MPPAPMLPTDGPPPRGAHWIAQPKMDGWRAIVTTHAGHLTIWSRRGTNLTDRFSHCLTDLTRHDLTLDGELVALGSDGRPRFDLVSAATSTPKLYAFDLLEHDDNDLRHRPLEERLDQLHQLDLPDCITVVPHGPVDVMIDATRHQGLEGIVAKRLGSTYQAGRRSPDWVRVKHWTITPMPLVAYLREHRRLRALLVTAPDGKPVKVELGITPTQRRQLEEGLQPLVDPQTAGVVTGRVDVAGGVAIRVRHHGPPERPRDPHFRGIESPL